jgi:hypothetical protein
MSLAVAKGTLVGAVIARPRLVAILERNRHMVISGSNNLYRVGQLAGHTQRLGCRIDGCQLCSSNLLPSAIVDDDVKLVLVADAEFVALMLVYVLQRWSVKTRAEYRMKLPWCTSRV